MSMKMDPSMDYPTFQAEFRKCCNNLQRARLQKGVEELKVDFLEKVPEDAPLPVRTIRSTCGWQVSGTAPSKIRVPA